MNREHLLDAIGSADDRLKQEVIDHMNHHANNRQTNSRSVTRTLRALPAVAVLMCLLAVTAYAAVNYWGIFDFQTKFPAQAQDLVQTQSETDSNDLLACTITESLNDGQQLAVTLRLEAKEAGKYVLLFQDYQPDLQAAQFGVSYDGTIEEYAETNDLKFLYVDASLKRTGEGGSGVQSTSVKYHSPELVDILIEADIADIGVGEGICEVTTHNGNPQSAEDMNLQEIPFTFPCESASNAGNVYRPTSQPDVEGLTIRSVTVTQTDLMTYFDIDMDMSEELMHSGMGTLRIWHGNTFDSAYGVLGDDGKWTWQIESSKMEVGDSFTLELWDPGDDSFTGEIEFVK